MQWIIVTLILVPCIGFVLLKAVRFLSNLQRAGDCDSNQSNNNSVACMGCSGANRSPDDLGIKLKPLVTLQVPKTSEQVHRTSQPGPVP